MYCCVLIGGKVQKKLEPFTLCMLGTDTNYTPEFKSQSKKSRPQTEAVADYPKGETLSIISTLIESSEVKIDRNNAVPYKSDTITVINGPVTLGSDVGKKIGLGLAEILLAVARGKQPINMIAHSRGAVESVLIAHELQAARTLINGCGSIEQLVAALKVQQTTRRKTSPTNNTPDITKSLRKQLNVIPQEQQAQWFTSLKANLPATYLNFFGIDPVPGDCTPITWCDERYFTLPSIVKNGQIFYYENERSDWGFTPAYVEAENPQTQQLKHDSIPGHHGTGSAGNNASQQKILLGGRTTHVQKLMIFKLLDFLNQSGVRFTGLGQSLFNEHVSLGTKHLKQHADGLGEQSVDISRFDFPAIYRALYHKIAEHRSAYDAYNSTHYRLMGLLELQRRLLKKGHKYGLFSDVFIRQEGLINTEHSNLIREELFTLFGLNDANCDLTSYVNQVCTKLPEIINGLEFAQVDRNLCDSVTEVFDFSEDKVNADEQKQKAVADIFPRVIESIGASYLNIDWSSVEKQKEKEQLFTEIKKLFASFNQLAQLKNGDAKPFVTTLKNQSINGINDVIKHQFNMLDNNFSQLQQSKDSRIAQYFKTLAQQFAIDISTEIDRILALSDYKLIADYPTKRKIEFIVDELRQSGVGPKLLKKIQDDFVNNNPPLEEQPYSQLNISKELTNAFVEQYEERLEQFAALYEQMDVFIKDIGGLMALLPKQAKKYAGYIENLPDQLKQLVQMAASTFYEHHKLNDLPVIVEDGFAVQVRDYAIAHYDGLAEQLQLTKEVRHLKSKINSLESDQNNVQRERQKQLVVLKATAQAQVKKLAVQHKARQAKMQQVQHQHQQQLDALNTTAQAQVNELAEQHKALQAEMWQVQHQYELTVQQITDDVAAEHSELTQQHKQSQEEQQQAHNEQLNKHRTEHTKVLALLHNEQEAQFLLLIRDTLRPLTRDYLQHLNASNTNPEVIRKKIRHAESLLAFLDDNVAKIETSKRVYNFYQALDQAAGDLREHRDPGWKLFVRNAVICGAILASGIIPGLLFLAAYTKITGNTYAFWSTQGAHYRSIMLEHRPEDKAPQNFSVS